jgi:AcrR family transcriptional regulator
MLISIMPEVLIRKRLTREESRAQTRERLLEAARTVFLQDGIEAVSIEEVAEAAGYSRGAFYSNFESKDDLLCAVLDREIESQRQEFDAMVAALPAADLMAKLRQYYVELGSDEGHCAFWLGLQLHAIRNAGIRPRVAELMRRKREQVISLMPLIYQAIGKEPPGSVETVALGLMSIAQGLALTRMLDQESVTAESLPRALETLFNQITGMGAGTAASPQRDLPSSLKLMAK